MSSTAIGVVIFLAVLWTIVFICEGIEKWYKSRSPLHQAIKGIDEIYRDVIAREDAQGVEWSEEKQKFVVKDV